MVSKKGLCDLCMVMHIPDNVSSFVDFRLLTMAYSKWNLVVFITRFARLSVFIQCRHYILQVLLLFGW